MPLFQKLHSQKVYNYAFSRNKIDIAKFNIGDKVRIKLDSNEIEYVNVIDKSSVNYFGEVLRIFDNDVLKIKTDLGNEIEINCNYDTEFRNVNGREINIGNVRRGDKVYVLMNERNSSMAKSVRIVGRN